MRLLAPDLARGMMLLFIAIANVSIYLWGQNAGLITPHPTNEPAIDTALAALVIVFIDASVYPMFAFLFGYGITQFAFARINRGVAPSRVTKMLVNRNLWLLVFGAIHAVLLFSGDVLGAYAITGLALVPLILRGSDRTMRIVLWCLAGVVTGFMLLSALSLIVMQLFIPTEFLMMGESEEFIMPGIATIMNGIENYWLAMLIRFGIWIASSVGAVFALIVPLTVLLGGFAARYRWLETANTRFKLRTVATLGIGVGVISAMPIALNHLGIWQMNELNLLGILLIAQLFGIANGIGYVALFAVIGQRMQVKLDAGLSINWFARAVAAVGKRSLTFYLFQSLVFAPILAAWGFGLGSSIGTAYAYIFAVVVWVISLLIATWLESKNSLGPAEKLLRKLTYGNDHDTR